MKRETDATIASQIREAIAKAPEVDLFNLRVDVQDGVALLWGVVRDLRAKTAAGEAASRILGVRRVENNISVEMGRQFDTDRELYEAAAAALEVDPAVDIKRIGVEVEAGLVKLVGYATSVNEEAAALTAIQRVPGVREVVSALRIGAGEPLDDIALTNHIMDALSLHPELVGYELRVDVANKGRVYLSGDVLYDKHRMVAERVVRSVPGVQRVHNMIAVQR
jgi:osmotically-inducible protein OsmY